MSIRGRLVIGATLSDSELVDKLRRVAQESPRDAQVAVEFARTFAASGTLLTFPGVRTADVASTGGPASLSTLLCPLFLRAAGFCVPKLGVPGRPAGGVDCLAQIAGYKTELTDDEVLRALKHCGYAHFTASGRFSPLDARVFRLRQIHGLQVVPTLVAASLLSKKLAVGVATAGLDIRVGSHGNFGQNFHDARANAAMYEEAASMLGISGRAMLTDGSLPYQPYIGRAEALVALTAVFEASGDEWLEEHLQLCRALSSAAAPVEAAGIEAVTLEELREVFLTNLVAQGATEDGLHKVVERVRLGHMTELVADRDGAASVSLDGVRGAIVAAQAVEAGSSTYPDPVGVILRRRPGDPVRRGDTLATVRVDTPWARENVLDRLKVAIRASENR